MFAIGFVALSGGDPNLLTYGFDSGGYLCGTANGLWGDEGNATVTTGPNFAKRTSLMYYDVTDYPTMTVSPAKAVCMSSCPTTTIASGLSSASFVCNYAGFEGYASATVDEYETQYYDSLSVADKASSIAMSGPCYPVLVPYTPVMNRCVPSVTEEQLAALSSGSASSDMSSTGMSTADLVSNINSMSSSRDMIQDYLEDLLKAWLVILVCGFLGGLVFSIVWMIFLRYFSGCMAWVTVVGVNLLLIILTLYCALKAGLLDIGAVDAVGVTTTTTSTNSTLTGTSGAIGVDLNASDDAELFEIATYVMAVVAGVALLFTLLMIRRLMIAIACLKVATQAIAAMPMILFSPLIPMLMNVLFMTWACFVAVYLYASGELKKGSDGTVTISWNETLQYMGLYHLFGVFWTTQFIAGFGVMMTAGAIASYYWQREEMPRGPIRKSIGRATRYHLGSIALGSFIVAVVQFVRAIMEYVNKKTKKLQDTNPVVKLFMCCIRYCLWYLEKVLKYINRNAYILVAVKGYSYCYSAVQAIKLIILNMMRIAAVNTVGDFLTWLGKVIVCGLCGFLAFLMCDLPMYTDTDSANYLSSPILPIIVTAFIGYVEADVFLSVYEMAVDTILLSFCEDCGTQGGPHYAPPLLMSALGKGTSSKVKASTED